jgi:hypothetical protein
VKLDQTTEALAPGTTRTREEYRPRSVSDLGTPLVWSAVAGAAVGGFVALLGEPARAAALVGIGVFGSAFLATSVQVIAAGIKVPAAWEETIRLDLDGDGVVGTPEEVVWTADIGENRRSHIARARIPVAQARAWRRFCQDVRDGACNFSGNAAEQRGVERGTFDALLGEWVSLDTDLALVSPSSVGPRQTPRLTERGKAAVTAFATTPLPQLRAQLEAVAGSDRQQIDS